METRLTLCNILARSIVKNLLHQILLRDQFHSKSIANTASSEEEEASLSSRSSLTIISSSTSSDSFFNPPDPDLPGYDRVFSSRASNQSRRRRQPIFRSTTSLYGYGSPPPATRKLCSDIQRVTYRRNAVVNQLQKTVTFPEAIKWPQAKFFTPEIGRQKIIEFIEKNWNYSPLLNYFVEYIGYTGYSQSRRFKYCANWKSPSGKISVVFFNIDTAKNNSERNVTVTFTFGDGKIVHKPHTSNFAARWLRDLEKDM
uniref:Uncharacterized protein n=1 Tax=Panagrolaimus sp. PS1159 TaxID=55785 RepID=A0AC35FLU6_9BILA